MRLSRIWILLFALALVAAACGGETSTTGVDDAAIADDVVAVGAEATHDEGEAVHEEGDAHKVEAAGDPDRDVEVVLTEFAFSPGTITVSMGETVRFIVRNEGVVEHEFRLTTEHAADEHVAAGHAGHAEGADAAESGEEHGEVMIMVAAGATETVDVAFTETAEFDIVACLIPGHFEAGMHGDLVIEA